jgi:hypothetical protein
VKVVAVYLCRERRVTPVALAAHRHYIGVAGEDEKRALAAAHCPQIINVIEAQALAFET